MRIYLALLLAFALLPASASPESDALKQQGMKAMAEGQFAQAAERFAAAMQADPGDTQAIYLHGAAANRDGKFELAERSLRRAEAAGLRDPELDFELGWSYMAQGRAQPCIDRLERFEAAAPGRGQASEFLGRCHLALNQHDRAEARFAEAVRRDARLAPTVNLSLAALEQARGRADAARARMETASKADAPTGRALRDLAGPAEPAIQPDKPLRLSLSFAIGNNSNVIGLGNTIPLPADISRKGALFTRLTAGAAYTHQLEADTAVTAGYAFLSDRYEDIGGANLLDHFVYADMFHQLNERFAFSLRASGEFTTLGGARFRDVLSFRPALSYRFSQDAVTELSWTLAQSEYLAASAPVFSRNGDSQTLSLVHSFRIPGTDWGGAVGASMGRNNTEGSDFSSNTLGLSGTLRYTFPNRIVAALGASVSDDDYRHPNSLTGNALARGDRQNVISGQVTGPFAGLAGVRWFAQAQSLRNRSNIAFYDYRQRSITAGVAYDF